MRDPALPWPRIGEEGTWDMLWNKGSRTQAPQPAMAGRLVLETEQPGAEQEDG